MAKRWTPEELAYLQDSWGVYSIETIAKNLNRSIIAVRLKAHRIGLGDPTLHFDGITVHQLSKALNISYSIILNWIQRYNFPAWRKKFSKNWRVLVVTYKDFWKWAEEHKHMIDFSRLEENLLGQNLNGRKKNEMQIVSPICILKKVMVMNGPKKRTTF